MLKHLFFDLDHTLWDFEKNSAEALQEIFIIEKLEELCGKKFDEFHKVYHAINHRYWDDYKHGKVKREALRNGRFIDTLTHFNVNDSVLANKISESYISISPYKKQLFEGAFEVLNYLADKDYQMHIITNGFNEVQFIKLENTGLLPYFKTITTSENAGQNKPHEQIFNVALQEAKAQKKESVMIGDNFEADVEGAIKSGLQAIWFNPLKESKEADFDFKTIHQLDELIPLF